MPKESCLISVKKAIGHETINIAYAILGVSAASLIMLLIHYPLWITHKESAIKRELRKQKAKWKKKEKQVPQG